MSELTLNFFGEKVLIEKNRLNNLSSLRKEISRLFYFSLQDASEILLTYNDNGDKIIIENEEDLKVFLNSKIKILDLDISQHSQIYKDSLNQLKVENSKDKNIINELIKKREELNKLKKNKFAKEKKEIEEIKKKIFELSNKKNNLKKKIRKGIKQIEKKIKENDKKILEIQKKLCLQVKLEKSIPFQNKMMELSQKYKQKNPLKTKYDKKFNVKKEPSLKIGAAKQQFGDFEIQKNGKNLTISWNSYVNATSYDVYRAESRYTEYKKIGTVKDTSFTDENASEDKYSNFYKIAISGSNELSQAVSLEIDMFGENMHIFSPSDDIEQIYNTINDIYKIQGAVDGEGNATIGQQFGSGRYSFAFKTGNYSNMKADNFDMSYYMQIIGLGKVPTDVKIKNVHVPAVLPNSNVTCNFWMNIENVEITPETVYGSNDVWFQFLWSVSQAAPARRLQVDRPSMLDWWYGWASGGYIADSTFKAEVGSYSQQQYYIRNCNLSKNFYGVNWNFVSQGVDGVSAQDTYKLESGLGVSNWKNGKATTIIDNTDVIREKPFLFFDENEKEYKVFAPALRKKSKGISWTNNNIGEGTILDISEFYIARADRDNAFSINKALNEGKNIILSPGIYYAEEPIQINNPNTIVLGLGLATIIPNDVNKDAAMKVADVSGVTIAGIIFDAQYNSNNMLVVGEKGCNTDHSSNPTILQDIFVRIGGVHPGVASTHQAVVINSNNVIGDDFWLWRADHGDGVGWDLNTAENGLVVNGDNVTMYGLMVEHFQEYDILWRGEYGKTYFLQNEKCYDPQNQNDWKSHEGKALGFAAYKVCNSVKNHYALGLGSYDVFIYTNGASIFLDNAFEVPDTEGVKIENACIVEIANGEGPLVGFNHIINGTGPSISTGVGGKGYARQVLISYCNTKSLTLDDYYAHGGNDSGIVNEEKGQQTSDDPKAEQDVEKDDKKGDDSDETKINVLLGKTATASSEMSGNEAKYAIDSDETTRWESQHGKNEPEWLQVDLGSVYIVSGFKIKWEAAGAKEYQIQVSIDGNSWTDVAKITDGEGGETRIGNFADINAKFIRLYATTKNLDQYGYSVFTFEVIGFKKTSAKILLKNNNTNKLNNFNILHRVKCNGCGSYPIFGCRFKCAVCEGFDYCEDCEKKLSDKHNHPFLKIYDPKMAPIFFKCLTKK